MGWIRLTPVNGPGAVFNTQHIAYIAAPPDDEAERGVGAGIALTDNTRDVIPVKEDWLQLAQNIGLGEILRP